MTVLDLFTYLHSLEQEEAAEAAKRQQEGLDAPVATQRRARHG